MWRGPQTPPSGAGSGGGDTDNWGTPEESSSSAAGAAPPPPLTLVDQAQGVGEGRVQGVLLGHQLGQVLLVHAGGTGSRSPSGEGGRRRGGGGGAGLRPGRR